MRASRVGATGVGVKMLITMVTMMLMTTGVVADASTPPTWTPLPMDDDRFRVVKSYAPPEYAVDDEGRARFRGWFASTARLDVGDDALATPVPPRARPTREETWKVTLKGHERTLTMTREGRLIVGDAYEADTWFALSGLEYDTAAAFDDAAAAALDAVADDDASVSTTTCASANADDEGECALRYD